MTIYASAIDTNTDLSHVLCPICCITLSSLVGICVWRVIFGTRPVMAYLTALVLFNLAFFWEETKTVFARTTIKTINLNSLPLKLLGPT